MEKKIDNAAELTNSKPAESVRMTEIEKKIIKFISEGLSDFDIAKKLVMKLQVVKGHIDNILEKMSLNNRIQIAGYKDSK